MASKTKQKNNIVKLNNPEILEELILQVGFLPFFRNEIPGFSVEEHTPRKLWFSDQDGPWEWKGPVIRNGNCAYAKFFNKKAGYISMEWFPDFLNYRRSMYTMNTENLAQKSSHTVIYETIREHDSLLSNEIKSILGYKKNKKKNMTLSNELQNQEAIINKGFETDITRLQMGTWIIIADFEYKYNKLLERYGWGIARYTTPEALFDGEKTLLCDGRTPEESRQRIMNHLTELLPDITENQIIKFIG